VEVNRRGRIRYRRPCCALHRAPEGADLTAAAIAEGAKAPNFSLEADDGTVVTRDSLLGKNVVLFFYPKDNTSG
jgi:peroxiredoxin